MRTSKAKTKTPTTSGMNKNPGKVVRTIGCFQSACVHPPAPEQRPRLHVAERGIPDERSRKAPWPLDLSPNRGAAPVNSQSDIWLKLWSGAASPGDPPPAKQFLALLFAT